MVGTFHCEFGHSNVLRWRGRAPGDDAPWSLSSASRFIQTQRVSGGLHVGPVRGDLALENRLTRGKLACLACVRILGNGLETEEAKVNSEKERTMNRWKSYTWMAAGCAALALIAGVFTAGPAGRAIGEGDTDGQCR